MKKIRAFAPATIANICSGTDILGLALDNPLDCAEVQFSSDHSIHFSQKGNSNLPTDENNTAYYACKIFREKIGTQQGVSLFLKKELPLKSGLGSSAASSVATLKALNHLFNSPLSQEELIELAGECEGKVSGSIHYDNVAPSLMGGIILIVQQSPLKVVRLNSIDLYIVLYRPHLEILTKDARNCLPQKIKLKEHILQTQFLSSLILGFTDNNSELIKIGLNDLIVEKARMHLYPHLNFFRDFSLKNGSMGSGPSGSGPSLFSFYQSEKSAKSAQKLLEQHMVENRIEGSTYFCKISQTGASSEEFS